MTSWDKLLDDYMARKNREELDEIEPNIIVVDELDLDLEDLWEAEDLSEEEELGRLRTSSWFTGDED